MNVCSQPKEFTSRYRRNHNLRASAPDMALPSRLAATSEKSACPSVKPETVD
eukprot:CAMPEP_0175445288 /NCGR_PEP_ID=MMETSP0095-20121207/59670_1 /TAXON_ID=311494 /ORGANISM="Alexandrium monilatum, Strain CCMP3105" /LENGTH=51 /DNA_ID=CAMNT_0016745511 /DNA_START=114 /DNA_END=266 /DNA_ORIENTATION=-